MSNTKTGGYCPMCDTVWASPGKCRCKPIEKPASEEYIDGFNAGIEAAAKEVMRSLDHRAEYDAVKIRSLKK